MATDCNANTHANFMVIDVAIIDIFPLRVHALIKKTYKGSFVF